MRITIDTVEKIYPGGVRAVDRVSLQVNDGEFLVLVGPSGCGKTTLLRMIAGLEETNGGAISIGDRRVDGLPPGDRDLAMVFQNYALYPHMTVRKNMAFALELRKLPKAEIERRVLGAAETLGLSPLLDRRPKELSGGQRQRVALGRAIVRQPAAFLFDEPLSNLDARLRVQMRAELKRLHRRLRTTALYVTHDQEEAMTLGDRVVVMKDGLVQQVGEPLTVYAKPRNRFVAGFIGSPAMNFIDCTVTGTDGALAVDAPGGFLIAVPPANRAALERYRGQPVTLGIRPEDIRESSPGDPKDSQVEAVVEVVEPLGNEILIDVKIGANPMVARVPPTSRLRMHERVRLSLDPEGLHFFDSKTEQAIE